MNNQAIPFISYNGKFEINQEAVDFLNGLDDVPLGVISIVGKYRTGKSFFVNRVLLNRQGGDGFSVGPTINPCTKGLWIWTQLIQTNNPDFPNMKALVIDTEGFGGMDENVNHDTRIFLFSLLLSSFFIYNSLGSIDENALNNISLIVNLAKEIQLKPQGDEQGDPSNFFPYFMWVVRDFALQMVDSNGTPMASREYLEKALEQQKGLSDAVEQKNRIRRLIKHFFRERDCVTMVRPVEAEKDLQRLDTMKNTDFRGEFTEQMKLVQSKIFKKLKPKMVQGAYLTGPLLAQLALAYVETMNSGKVPDVESAWGFVCRAEGEKAVYECTLEIEKQVNSLKSKVMSPEEMSQQKLQIQDRIFKLFKSKAIGQEDDLKQFKDKISQQLEIQYKTLKQNNKANLQSYYTKVTDETVHYIETKLRNEEYQNFFELQSEMFKFRENFEKEVGRSAGSTRFFLSLSVQIYQQAAERLSHKAAQKSSIEVKRLEHKCAQLEQEVSSRRGEWDQERSKFYDMIQSLEREKAQLSVSDQSYNEKIAKFNKELQKSEQLNDELKTALREKDILINTQYQEKLNHLSAQLDKARSEIIGQQSQFDKESALMRQENLFLKREAQNFSERVQFLEQENKKYRSEVSSLTSQCEALQQRCSQIDQGRAIEIQKLQQEFERKVQELTDDINKKKQQVRQQNEWLVEKNYLENQVGFLKNQLEENKRLHDALLIALQQGMTSQDTENTQELVETNRNLSAAMDKIEMRCKILEEKSEKLKKFKKMVKNCTSMQCAHCQKQISQSIFNQHLQSCSTANQNLNNINNLNNTIAQSSNNQIEVTRQSSALLNMTQVTQAQLQAISTVDLSSLQISINQTMVRETSDNKPYTEYMIKVQYMDKKWTVSRRYKNFCELHQSLSTTFQGLKLPDSQSAIISVQDINNIFQAKRPTVIEDRRKALQQYIRDLAKIDIVRNSKVYKKFLELEPDVPESSVNQSQIKLSSQQLPAQHQQSHLLNSRSSATSKEISLNVSRIPLNSNGNVQNSYRIDKRMLPQSPQSFLKAWNEKNGERQHRENTQRFTSDLPAVYMNNFQ